jgi:hypothetical protein
MKTALLFLILHGILGGIDVVFNHELTEHLPKSLAAKKEVLLHSLREGCFAIIFLSFAWLQTFGAWALVISFIIMGEIVVTGADAIVEDRTRRLSAFERIIHVLLFINTGIYLVLLAPIFSDWFFGNTALQLVDYGWLSLILSTLGLLAVGWSIRDFRAYLFLRSVD